MCVCVSCLCSMLFLWWWCAENKKQNRMLPMMRCVVSCTKSNLILFDLFIFISYFFRLFSFILHLICFCTLYLSNIYNISIYHVWLCLGIYFCYEQFCLYSLLFVLFCFFLCTCMNWEWYFFHVCVLNFHFIKKNEIFFFGNCFNWILERKMCKYSVETIKKEHTSIFSADHFKKFNRKDNGQFSLVWRKEGSQRRYIFTFSFFEFFLFKFTICICIYFFYLCIHTFYAILLNQV